MLSRRFLQIIDNSFIGSIVDKRIKVLHETDPDHIYIENVRSFFHIPYKAAQFICELAVKEGRFRKHIGITCPKCGRIISSVESEKDLPSSISCITCEINEEEGVTFKKSEYGYLPYYEMIRK